MVEGTVVELAIPTVVSDMFGIKLITEVEDTKGARFSGVKVVLGVFERSEFFNREVLREAFNREAGEIVGHSIQL